MTALNDRSLLATTAALLHAQSKVVDQLSRLLTAGSLFSLLFHAVMNDADPVSVTVALICAALAGLVQINYAVRVGFDAALFLQLADAATDLASMDRALNHLGLMPADKAGRPIEARIAGARALMRWQGLAMTVQIVVLLSAALVIVLT